MSAMTCTYLDKKGNIMLVETIPVPEKKKKVSDSDTFSGIGLIFNF